ncbi:hypothetical protein, partial [Frankia sp. AvcI1]|uniref:hypothetical protein n=1 Tax=Frankia sp. AvcI1 TaxID=573496 RepID=UPI001F32D76E
MPRTGNVGSLDACGSAAPTDWYSARLDRQHPGPVRAGRCRHHEDTPMTSSSGSSRRMSVGL